MRTHIEMEPLQMGEGWTPLKGFSGLESKLLASDLDETTRTGARTRFVRFAPGTQTTDTLVHTYWEEVYLLSGDMFALGAPPDAVSAAPLYSLRPPGTPHGPFGTREGCLVFEVQYYVKSNETGIDQ